MATILAPATHSATESTVGFSYVFAEEAIREEITERLNVLQQGIVMGVGDLQGSGSDTVRVTRFGSVGFAEQMTAMVTEDDPIVPTGYTINNDSISLGRYGLAKNQTYQDKILQRAEAIGLMDLAAKIPESFLATLRSNVVVAGSTFSSSISRTGVDWDFDAELLLIASFRETEGFDGSKGIISIRHPEQYTDLMGAIRNEPGLQNDANLMQSLLGISGGANGGDGKPFEFLGMRHFGSFDVPTSSGDHVGCAYVPGALAWVVAGTQPVDVENPAASLFIPEFGIIVERSSTGETATARFNANAFFGTAKLSATLFPQFKLLSVNN